ncbi:MAG: AMP-binding protein, partial [Polyangiales bacterium]
MAQHEQAATRIRAVRLGPTGVHVERSDTGRFSLRAHAQLSPHPTRLTDKLVEWAARAPERVWLAKRDAHGAWQRLSYGAALVRVQRIAAALLERGLTAERPLMILSENDLEFGLLSLAALHVGVPFVPVSPAYSLRSRDHERLREVVALLTPGAVFAASGSAYAGAIRAAVPDSTEVILTEGELAGRNVTRFAALEERTDDATVERAHGSLRADAICKFLLTSGSTGTPKAVIHTHGMLSSNQQMLADTLAFLADEPPLLVDWLPWHHTFGGNHNFGLALYHGGS